MGKIQSVTTLRVEDFDSAQRSWLPTLFTPLNLFITSVTNAINGNINFSSNIPAQDVALAFNFNGSAQRFAWTQSQQPNLLWVGQAYENGTAVPLSNTWSFDASNSSVSVTFYKLSGVALTQGAAYKIFVRVTS